MRSSPWFLSLFDVTEQVSVDVLTGQQWLFRRCWESGCRTWSQTHLSLVTTPTWWINWLHVAWPLLCPEISFPNVSWSSSASFCSREHSLWTITSSVQGNAEVIWSRYHIWAASCKQSFNCKVICLCRGSRSNHVDNLTVDATLVWEIDECNCTIQYFSIIPHKWIVLLAHAVVIL